MDKRFIAYPGRTSYEVKLRVIMGWLLSSGLVVIVTVFIATEILTILNPSTTSNQQAFTAVADNAIRRGVFECPSLANHELIVPVPMVRTTKDLINFDFPSASLQ